MPDLFSNASWGGASAAVRLFFGMCNIFLAIRLTGAVFYGYLTLMSSATAFYVAVFGSIFTITVTRAAELRHGDDSSRNIDALFSIILTLTLLSVVILGLAAFFLGQSFLHAFVYWGGDPLVESSLSSLLVLVAIIAVCQILSAANVAVIESLGRFDLAARAQIFGPPVVFSWLAFGYFSGSQMNIADVGKAMLAGSVVDLIVITWVRLKMRQVRMLILSPSTIEMFVSLFKQGMALQGAGLINVFFDPFNKYLLNRFVGPASVSSYEIAMKIIFGMQGLFGGAFRTFLQLSKKLRSDGSDDYLKALRYGLVPAALFHGIGGVFLVMVSHYWLKGEVRELVFFYLCLIPAGLGIIFASPLYSALIGIRDLGFIFRMHLNLAAFNFLASLILIPIFGLYGAGVGLSLTTAYNAFAEYRRYTRMIGPVPGLPQVIQSLAPKFIFSLTISVAAIIAGNLVTHPTDLLIVEGTLVAVLFFLLASEPLSSRIMVALRGAFREKLQ